MSTNKNLSLAIGAFLFGALLLIFIALLFFSGGRLFAQKQRVVMYFEGSVQGLQIGAPIKLKGVVLGEIDDIQINFESLSATQSNAQGTQATQPAVTTVIADLVLERISTSGLQASEKFLTEAVNKGLRAQLNYQSFLTGLLYVELDFHPDTPAKRYRFQDDYVEIPTMATEFEEFSKKFQNINLEDLVSNMNQLANQLRTIVASGDIERTLNNANNTLITIDNTAKNLNHEISIISKDLQKTLTQADIFMAELNSQTPIVANSLRSSLNKFDVSLEKFNRAADQVSYTFSEDAPIINKLDRTLEDISRSAKALRTLSETLDQQPDALWRGRGDTEE